jgi:hypothetical protein
MSAWEGPRRQARCRQVVAWPMLATEMTSSARASRSTCESRHGTAPHGEANASAPKERMGRFNILQRISTGFGLRPEGNSRR